MKRLNRVDVLYYPRKDLPIPANPLLLLPENVGIYRVVSFVPASVVTLPKVDGMTKQFLFNHVPGLQDFVERAFHDKVIVSLNPVITVTVEMGNDSEKTLPDWMERHLADTSLKPGW